MQAILGKKQGQTQKFLTDGTRVPVTEVSVDANQVLAIKNMDRDGYIAVQLGLGNKKHATQAQKGHSKKGANLDYAPNFLREIRQIANVKVEDLPKPGDKILANAVLEPGDIIDVTGKSKGKGFAGVVKRHNFKGGPRTHGQSDRERAPGSIGQTTTPGRVYKGKRMAGKMGNDTVTLKNLEVIDVTDDGVLIKGLVPGIKGTYLIIKKVGKNKKHIALLKESNGSEDTNEPKVAASVKDSGEPKEDKVEAKTEEPKVPEETKEPKAEEKKEEVKA